MTVLAEKSTLHSDSSFDQSGNAEENTLKKICKQTLKKAIFIGTFQEKRFVAPLNTYKDVIKVDDEETDFIRNLKNIRMKLIRYYSNQKWIGITIPETIGAPVGHNLWVNLNEEIFGKYWFKVKTVKFHRDEIFLVLNIVRPVTSINNTSSLSNEFDAEWFEPFTANVKRNLTSKNIKEACVFMFILTSALITGLIELIKYVLDYFIKFIDISGKFIHLSTPLLLGIFDNISRLVAYTILLIYKCFNSPANNRGERMIVYKPNNLRAINY